MVSEAVRVREHRILLLTLTKLSNYPKSIKNRLLNKNPGFRFKGRVTKPVNLVALTNAWLANRKPPKVECMPC